MSTLEELRAGTETVKNSELVGKRVRLVVRGTPCVITMEGATPLCQTTWATYEGLIKMPLGPIMFARDDGGNRIAFDSNDLRNGRVEIELPESSLPNSEEK